MRTTVAAQANSQAVAKNPNLMTKIAAGFAMTKPTVSMLVVVTVVPGMLLAAGGWPEPVLVLATIVGTFFASGSAAIFNHLVEIDSDALMDRTKTRPIQNGMISAREAAVMASIFALLSLLILTIGTTLMAALVALAANAFYVLGYTMYLKRRTTQNIVIGGAAGAVGPLIGWAAVRGDIGLPAWALFTLIFMWTPPHFWALALKYKDDYAKANIPMLPVVRGDEYTRKSIMIYAWLLLPVMLWVNIVCNVSSVFAVFSMAFTAGFAWLATKLYRQHTNDLGMPVFHYSCFYLFALFCGLTIDKLWQLV